MTSVGVLHRIFRQIHPDHRHSCRRFRFKTRAGTLTITQARFAAAFHGRFQLYLRKTVFLVLLALVWPLSGAPALAEASHAIAMHGEPALPPDYRNFPYVNPDAPKGGDLP